MKIAVVFTVIMCQVASSCQGQKRTVFCRHQFWAYKRPTGITFDEFLVNLQTLAQLREFTERYNMIRDKIIFTIAKTALKERMLREETLTLNRTITLCRAHETAQGELESMAATAHTDQALQNEDVQFLMSE
ncbi:hypothetical protein CAPTEDRAFT_185501 [Capitella teleta]|uniref:Uncharacterized protein n=1 Tax=Capitella teleta TaxID=283909 RepID=R7VD91_CAPTE|nr:hypothetical protein CAPTEDRAFT_185501 [Capitella teleta]|eukprot:ELU16537.1 hypothetical protein CAPTEDRAFT_185501 [Capitella teleta]